MQFHPEARFLQVRRLTELSRMMTYAVSAAEVFDLTLKETARLLKADQVVLLVQDGRGLSIRARPSWFEATLAKELRNIDEEAIGRLQELLTAGREARFLAVPLVITGEVAGVLAVVSAQDSGGGVAEDEWVLSAIADQAAVAFEKIHLNEVAAVAEKLRREREEQFQTLYDSPLIGLVFTHLDGRVLDANEAFLALSGFGRSELEQGAMRWDALVAARHPARAVQGGPRRMRPFEAELTRRDGRRGEVLVGITRLEEQDRKLAFVVDISAQKRAEASLRLLSEVSSVLIGTSLDYSALLKSLAFLVVPRFADWCAIESVEEGAMGGEHVAIENLSPSRVEGALEWRRQFPPDPNAKSGIAEVIRTQQSQLHEEIPDTFLAEYACDGDHVSELERRGLRSAMLVPLVLHRRVVGVITFVRAMSRPRYRKEDLLIAEEIGRRAASAIDNARLYQQAQEAIGLRDEFLSVAAHELKTPLTTLQLQLDALEHSWGDGKEDRARRRLEKASRQARRLARLVEELLDVSRITTRRLMLEREPCDLVALVRDVVSQFDLQASNGGSSIELDLPDASVIGHWDRARVEQVVANLLSNAIKYGPGKPIRICVRSAEGMARLIVKDQGIGIPRKDLRRIFGKFERAVSTRHYGGLGLGLYIARQITEAHGGHIDVHSRPEQGAEFVVHLPLFMGAEASSTERVQ